jgi:hypothetical protein
VITKRLVKKLGYVDKRARAVREEREAREREERRGEERRGEERKGKKGVATEFWILG